MLTLHSQRPSRVMNAKPPAAQQHVIVLLCFQSRSLRKLQGGRCECSALTANQKIPDSLIHKSSGVQHSNIDFSQLILNCYFSFFSSELWNIISMFKCNHSKELCEKLKVNEKADENIRQKKINICSRTDSLRHEHHLTKKMQSHMQYSFKIFLWKMF